MGLKLHQIKKQKAPFDVTIEVDGGIHEVLKGNFNPAIYTPDYIAQIRSMDNQDPHTLARIIAPCLVDWEMVYTDEDLEYGLCKREEVGTMCPLTHEFLGGLPLKFLTSLLQGIQKGNAPDPNSGAKSSDSSFNAEEEGPVLTNTDS